MKFLNCSIDEAIKSFKNKKIVFFGAGSWIKSIMYSPFISLKDDFYYIVDNKGNGSFSCNGVSLNIYTPDILNNEKNIIIILTSPLYMYDMFMQLQSMMLPESIECYAFPFMQMISDKNFESGQARLYMSHDKQKIPKKIHSFWFSGDEKPHNYQKCIDTWREHLSDYEIIEWNINNYDWTKHPFLKRAIEVKAWAFATDYARIDVLNQYGGIYLDMDVEVYKPFDELLGNDAILAYSNNIQIDMAVMASKKCNPLMLDLLRLYDTCKIPETKKEFSAYFQPSFVKPLLYKKGIRMDGGLQQIENATVFPKEFFMPLDQVLNLPFEIKEYTFCNHLSNFEWGVNGIREKKIKDNRKLWEMLN